MDVHSPHDGSLIGKVALSVKNDVDAAVKASQDAFEKWSKWTVKERVKPLLKLRQILEEKEDELAELIMLEHGKNRIEALGSIRKGNETVEYVKSCMLHHTQITNSANYKSKACGMHNIIAGKILEVSNGVRCTEFYEPHGVCASIVPFAH